MSASVPADFRCSVLPPPPPPCFILSPLSSLAVAGGVCWFKAVSLQSSFVCCLGPTGVATANPQPVTWIYLSCLKPAENLHPQHHPTPRPPLNQPPYTGPLTTLFTRRHKNGELNLRNPPLPPTFILHTVFVASGANLLLFFLVFIFSLHPFPCSPLVKEGSLG